MKALIGVKNTNFKNIYTVVALENLSPVKATTIAFVIWLEKPTEDERMAVLQCVKLDESGGQRNVGFPQEIKGY